MKATGIVRRIDDLGRVVIPKTSAVQCVSVKMPLTYIIDTDRCVL